MEKRNILNSSEKALIMTNNEFSMKCTECANLKKLKVVIVQINTGCKVCVTYSLKMH